MYYDHGTCTYCEHTTCMLNKHRTGMHHDQKTHMYPAQTTCEVSPEYIENHPTLQTDHQTDRQTHQQSNRQTDRLIDKQTGRQTSRQINRHTNRQTYRQTGRLQHTHRHTDVPGHRLADEQTGNRKQTNRPLHSPSENANKHTDIQADPDIHMHYDCMCDSMSGGNAKTQTSNETYRQTCSHRNPLTSRK